MIENLLFNKNFINIVWKFYYYKVENIIIQFLIRLNKVPSLVDSIIIFRNLTVN